ncbi:thiamine phosphate synthase [Aerococcus viridans]|uniref:Thiamine-phosphate synthase n=2 Tax=Aerococcaceae TaxID=186827 RepID=A0A2N6UGB2_9LACT|nr:thiamine phosphate synthase [Aerococcus viridans]
MSTMIDYRLYLVTNAFDYHEDVFLQVVEEAIKAGVTLVQYRDKTATSRDAYALALKLKAITDRYAVPLIIDDRVDLALAVDAAGVHIGDDELPVDVVRKLIGSNKILGVSAKTIDRAKEAYQQGADYLGVGAIFPTTTKDSSLVTKETLRTITSKVPIPIVAIGGIHLDNMDELKDTGIAGISVVSEIMLADSVPDRVRQLRANLTEILEVN